MDLKLREVMKFTIGLLVGSILGITAMYFGVTTGITVVSQSSTKMIEDDKVVVDDIQIKYIERANLLPDGYPYPSKGFIRGYAFLGACNNGKWMSDDHYEYLPDCDTSLAIPVVIKPNRNFFLHAGPKLSSRRLGFMHAYSEVRLIGYEPLGKISEEFTYWMGELDVPKASLGAL